jgi:hypothetical protein
MTCLRPLPADNAQQQIAQIAFGHASRSTARVDDVGPVFVATIVKRDDGGLFQQSQKLLTNPRLALQLFPEQTRSLPGHWITHGNEPSRRLSEPAV